jgi:3-oxoacyl-[acyl-carrier protein] reductase
LFSLQGKTALISGAGSAEGIGFATARLLGELGCRVALCATGPRIHERAASLREQGIAAQGYTADLTVADEVDRLLVRVTQDFPRIDILVNGVGGWQKLSAITDIPDAEWDDTITLNLKSAFLCIRAVSKIMIAQKRGRIINMASQSGVGPNTGANSNIPYACSKAAIIVLTKHLAKQLGPDGITVNTVSPGTTLTPRVAKVWDLATQQKKAAGNPLRCLVEPQDSADAILFLASEDARHITGVNLNVNAGSAMV